MHEDWRKLVYWLRDLKNREDRPDDVEWIAQCEEAATAIDSLLFAAGQWRSNYSQLKDENRYLRTLIK